MGIGPVGVGKEVPLRLIAQVETQEAEVQVEEIRVQLAGQIGGHHVPVGMVELGKLNLQIGAGAAADLAHEALADKVVLQDLYKLLRHKHHAAQGLADDGVQRDQDGEGNQRPEAAGHGVDALFLVQLLHLGVELLLVALMPLLQLLNLGLEAGGAHHALLALGHEGSHDEVDGQGEKDQCQAVVAGQVVEPDHQLGKGPGYDFPK